MKKLALLALSPIMTLRPLASSLAAPDQQPIRLIVQYTAGGPIDVTARILAEGVRNTLGPVIIENKPGGGGNIGSDVVAKAAPDGRVIGIAALASHAVTTPGSTARCLTTLPGTSLPSP